MSIRLGRAVRLRDAVIFWGKVKWTMEWMSLEAQADPALEWVLGREFDFLQRMMAIRIMAEATVEEAARMGAWVSPFSSW